MNDCNVPWEISVLAKLKHIPGVIDILDYYEETDVFGIIMEKPESCMDLFDFINKNEILTEALAKDFFLQIVSTVSDIQNCGLVHGDIKAENIIIDLQTGLLKLIDFGHSSLLTDHEICRSSIHGEYRFVDT